ncbi:MAG TPA: LPS assembly lipoprotein LptE [Rubrivivax sp.]|nr:LPS assembly lipoprotein LptE [Rubrivivax sp.]HPO17806.1 LPS assembly lipoprotein LptE [Rubrivivax sp.]
MSEAALRRRALLLAAPAWAVAGCGFELRRAAELHFDSIALAGFAPRSALERELRAALERSIAVKEAPTQAQVVLQALQEQRVRRVVAFTASGQVRDIQLRKIFRYRAQTPSERELIPDARIELVREMTFIESAALGKQQEEEDLFREMRSDIVQQVLLRLSSIRL